MSKPKRHHWWPMVQSSHWTNAEGLVYASRADGSSFRPNPLNIGVESELYTRFKDGDGKDTAIEDWFAKTIDSPATTMIEYLTDRSKYRRQRFEGDPKKAEVVRELGFRTPGYIADIPLPEEIRLAISRYLAAMLVRHPTYLEKLVLFHSQNASSEVDARNRALDNMLYLHEVYTNAIRNAVISLTRRVGTSEYLYADGGLVVTEPWRSQFGIPFDIHAPLTPELAIEVLPVPYAPAGAMAHASIMEATNQGVARQNRIVLGGAKRFVFSRQAPPTDFIKRYFGVPAPRNIGYRFIDSQLETNYDRSRG